MVYSDGNISIRKIGYGDTDNIVRWRNLPDVKNNLYTQTDLTAEQHIWWMQNKVDKGLCAQFIIEMIEPQTPIGTVFIKNIDRDSCKGEYGIFIGEDIARGKGYGKIAAKLAVQYAFEVLELNRVYLSVFKDNISGIKSYESAGFVVEGIFREDYKKDGKYFDVVYMAILKSDWEKRVG